jgi:DNA polymerase-3 subunit epsilon
MLDFTAIDFETANQKRASPCSLGIARVCDGKIVDSSTYLIRPHPDHFHFSRINVAIHGIEEAAVADSPEFPSVYGEIAPFVQGATIAAHNASFDVGVLRRTAETYGIKPPECDVVCTVAVSKSVWPDLISFSLPIVADHVGLQDFVHHDAEEDARASALVLVAACRKLEVDSISELSRKSGFSVGRLKDGEYLPSSPSRSCKISSFRRQLRRPEPSPTHPLWDKDVAFTGVLRSMTREEAFDLVNAAGGRAHSSPSSKTEYLVLGIQCYTLFRNGGKSNKTIKAEQLREQGYPIEIISEDDFLKLVYPDKA